MYKIACCDKCTQLLLQQLYGSCGSILWCLQLLQQSAINWHQVANHGFPRQLQLHADKAPIPDLLMYS
jgi:type II secretory pathway predicted ATPase ExeA